ncbi:hypothetical protein OROGR_018147 [Orobanche gracilis]
MKRGVAAAAAVTAAAMVVGTAVLLRRWKRRSERRWRLAQRILRKFANDSATPVAKLWRVADEIASEAEGNSSSLCKIVSDIAPLPTGEEKGTFYGVNLRGDDFVIVRARLEGRNEPLSELRKQKVQIPSGILANGGSSKAIMHAFFKIHKYAVSDTAWVRMLFAWNSHGIRYIANSCKKWIRLSGSRIRVSGSRICTSGRGCIFLRQFFRSLNFK